MSSTKLHILFIYPTRGRRQRFIDGLQSIFSNVHDHDNFSVQVNCDSDDPEMQGFADSDIVKFVYGSSKSKVDACNRKPEQDFDVLIVMQDDLRFTLYGFDEIIRHDFKDNLDLLLHYPDQDAGADLATIYIAGSAYYKRFGYVYHPEFSSLYCDNLVMDVAQKLDCYKFSNVRIFNHLNSAYGHLPKDEMFIQQQEIGYSQDKLTYERLKAQL